MPQAAVSARRKFYSRAALSLRLPKSTSAVADRHLLSRDAGDRSVATWSETVDTALRTVTPGKQLLRR